MERILSKKDIRILKELNKDSRQSFSAIGKKIGLPKNVVNYRIKKMVDEGLLTLFCTTLNRSKLGFNYCRLFLKFQHFSEELENELVAYLRKLKGIYWVARLEGNFDFCVIFLARNIHELSETYDSIIYKFSSSIIDKEFSLATHVWYLPYNYLYDKNEDTIAEVRPESEVASLDKNDWRIISMVKENSRIPMLTLMKKLNMSPQVIRKRISALKKRGIITGYNIRIDHAKFKLHHFHTFLYLSNMNEDKERKIVHFLSSKKSTTHIIKGTGKWGLEFESVFPSHFELHDMLKELKDKFPENIAKYDSGLIYKIYPINTVKYEIPATFK